MNTYFEKLLLASKQLENRWIARLHNLELDDNFHIRCTIETYRNEEEINQNACYLDSTAKEATLLFLEEPSIIDDKIIVHFTKEIYRWMDKNKVLHAYKKGTYIKDLLAEQEFPKEIDGLYHTHGELIPSKYESVELPVLIHDIFGKMNNLRHHNKEDYFNEYNIKPLILNSATAYKEFKKDNSITDLNRVEEYIEQYYHPKTK